MKKILFIIIFCSLFSGSAFAAKRVCIFVHKNYMEVKEPVLLAKRRMIVDLAGCEEGNTAIQNTQDYKIYHFKKRDKILKLLYPIITKNGSITKDGSKGFDQWTLDKFEIILGEEQYKLFNLPTSAERKSILEKKAKENKKKAEENKKKADENKKKVEENKKKAEEKKKKITDKQETEAKKTDNPAEERNKLLISCLKDNRETSIKLKNKECEAYADGKEVDIGDDSGNPNEFSEMSKKNDKIRKYNYDQRYDKCYTEMTVAHSRRGLLKSNIEFSSNVRRGICKAYARGEEINYEGKR